ncbi:MAG: MBL fold metallo-hydrolase [SAR202 cluster bacterium]|nr:MBL fold metallo-hydrolase [SAR202 cluster bacterium]
MNRLFILGSGAPQPANDRFGSSYVLKVGDEHLMFDCGPGTTYKLFKMGMTAMQIDHLFFTHHHFDHDVDYPCLVLTRWDSGAGKIKDLNAFGPRLTERLTKRILDEHTGAFAHDWIARVNHPLSLGAYTFRGGVLPRRPPAVNAKDVGPGAVAKGKSWEVIAAPAVHVQPYLDSLAYRVNTDEGSYVFTGDTAICDSVINLARGADVVFCNTTCIDEDYPGTPDLIYMMGTDGASRIGRESGAKQLVIVHNRRIASPGLMERAIGEIAKQYDGQIVFGAEMMEVPPFNRPIARQ